MSSRRCNICGSDSFTEGLEGRTCDGVAPRCDGCQSVERHRVVRGLYQHLGPVVHNLRTLHFAPDRSVEPDWFKSYLGSVYGGAHSLDMTDTGLPDRSFGLVIATHVLEHIEDDMKAVREAMRLVGKQGVVHLCVPAPLRHWETRDWGFADPAINGHYRTYGGDFPLNVCALLSGVHAIGAIGMDPVTRTHDIVYFYSRSLWRLEGMATLLHRAMVPVARFA